ncbi:hypothetical protein NLU13_0751 [Sarocladium strictum]|uniref:FAR1 domain-containing protein n=1 Tax=Sarocladium strictum TaxID=5046 RepID=A0AA39LBQ5_SARSR|nr:hypothetical protein NLU13_0751 [Sarocladium strictum]
MSLIPGSDHVRLNSQSQQGASGVAGAATPSVTNEGIATAPESAPVLDDDDGDRAIVNPIPVLPGSPEFESFDEAKDYVFAFLYNAGAGMVTRYRANKRLIDGIYQPSMIHFKCDRGHQRRSEGHGLRDKPSKKIGCPWSITIKCPKRLGRWIYEVKGSHSHGRSLDPSTHQCFRKRTPQQLEVIRMLALRPGCRPREILDATIRADPDHSHLRMRDLYNEIAKARRGDIS